MWVSLPLTVGSALADAVSGWPRASSITLAVLMFGGWTVGLVALLAPHPVSFTVLRVVGPAAFAVALWCVVAASGGMRAVAAVHAAATAAIALSEPVARTCAAAAAYGNERRFALRVPPVLVPVLAIAVAIVVAGGLAGPLLLADSRWVAGTIAVVVGAPLAVAAARSIHTFSRRFIVLVPAGLVVADALVLGDPVLLPRERMRAVHRVDGDASGPHAVDTRLGAAVGGVAVDMDDVATFSVRRGRRDATGRTVATVLFTPLRATPVLDACAQHRLPVV